MPGVGRFRVNAFRARGAAGPGLPAGVASAPSRWTSSGSREVLGALALEPRGLVLVTGPTGSGKTTTLAGMVDQINTDREVHIVTIEDPIEVLHFDKLAMVNQREVRVDTEDFATALRAAMRQDPDVILVGEMRDTETVKAALSAAETGHFVMSTLHTTDAQETDQPDHRLLPAARAEAGRGCRWPARCAGSSASGWCRGRRRRAAASSMEIMVNTGRIADAIADPDKTSTMTELITEGAYYGMQTFDQHLVTLIRDGVVTLEDAMAVEHSPHDLTSSCVAWASSPDPCHCRQLRLARAEFAVPRAAGAPPAGGHLHDHPPRALRAVAGRAPTRGLRTFRVVRSSGAVTGLVRLPTPGAEPPSTAVIRARICPRQQG